MVRTSLDARQIRSASRMIWYVTKHLIVVIIRMSHFIVVKTNVHELKIMVAAITVLTQKKDLNAIVIPDTNSCPTGKHVKI